MRTVQRTLAIIALLVLVTQTVRHAYLLWLEPRHSALDKYDQPLKDEIAAATSLDELLRRYEPLRKQVDAAKQERAKSGNAGAVLPFGEELQSEPYKSERMLRDAITSWEAKAKEIHALRFYCLVGFVLCAFGVLAYFKLNRWFGLTLIITAFSEFIYWTSPTFLGATTREFDRLLGNKLALSMISLVILLAVIASQRVFHEQREELATPARAGT